MSLKVQWNDSGELDVFEATEYFSNFNEDVSYNGTFLSQKAMTEERQVWGGRRMSLDSHSHRVDNLVKGEKQKPPRSPGGRVASFLKTLFHKKKISVSSMNDEEDIPDVGRRKRRSSMSLFQSIKTNDSKSVYVSSAASGFRTPPCYIDNAPIKICKDLRSCSDHKNVVSLPKYRGNYVKPVTAKDEALDGKKQMESAWLDEKINFIDGFPVKEKSTANKDGSWVLPEKKNVKMSFEVDGGGESDSSSDLFELENKAPHM